VHAVVRKLFVATLLSLCVGVHVFELAGRWDRTFQDANDEAGIVAVVLCIGVAVSVAGTILERIGAGTGCCLSIAPTFTSAWMSDFRCFLPVYLSTSPPPVPLRI
jgi:hypothetical protein